MPKYRIKAGTHSSAGRTYKQGDIIDTHKDLIKAFPQKFELVHEAPKPKVSVVVGTAPISVAIDDPHAPESGAETEASKTNEPSAQEPTAPPAPPSNVPPAPPASKNPPKPAAKKKR